MAEQPGVADKPSLTPGAGRGTDTPKGGAKKAAKPVKPSPAPPPGALQVPEALRKKLARLGLHGDNDLLLHLPLRYEDETRLYMVADAPWGLAVQVEATVLTCEVQFRPRRQLVIRAEDDAGTALWLRFFSFYPSQQAALAPGKRLRFFGEVRNGFFGAEMVHPRFTVADEDKPLPDALTPVYPTTAGVAQSALRKLIGRAMAKADLSDTLAEEVLARLRLPDFAGTLRTLHTPGPEVAQAALEARDHPAWRRIIFDELLAQQLSLRKAYRARRELGAPVLDGHHDLADRLLATLPFGLTGAQRRAVGEIVADLGQPHPMQRLLQGDVGSGKTIVAALAACQAIAAGWQVAFMAPTEILAEQHYLKLKSWLEPLGVQVAWLSGSLKASQKRAGLAKAAGEAQLVVGTHALIQDGVDFARLGLAIIDEQHRFGVAQRLTLRKKGEAGGAIPHQLMMSATPIPRTLAMSYYADLDVSVLDELPPGRTPIKTRLVADSRRDDVVAFVERQVELGRQAYWVCPLIEESEALQLQTAQDTFAQLQEDLPGRRIGLVHGRLKADEKQATMAAFAAGELDVLVATTVIEVGVDVPNASLMVIEHAERFGLAQLHQLRGPGEFIGSRQSGVPMLRYADLERDAALVEVARDLAEAMLAKAPARAERHLARWLGSREELLKA